MRAVSGEVVSSKPVGLHKAARVFRRFAAREASRLPAGAGVLVLCAAEAAAELHAFRCARVGPDGEAEVDAAPSGEERRKKRRKTGREGVSLE
ncbi:hypothetical protein CFC21_069078 [Triticum aestivum]|uniref:Uncharacterized protein n=2 Tax=Triticum aestivum TaxID=4565 RepID=A0A9R1KQD2_WHEAT|nr:hypothetical protein CFC21_069078 [Triticum aestivum]